MIRAIKELENEEQEKAQVNSLNSNPSFNLTAATNPETQGGSEGPPRSDLRCQPQSYPREVKENSGRKGRRREDRQV